MPKYKNIFLVLQTYICYISWNNIRTLTGEGKMTASKTRFILTVIFFLSSMYFMVSCEPAETCLECGLVAFYPFNGNANDESGNENDGTVNGATLTADRDGNPNSAYSFDGVDDYIEADDSETLDISGPITISSWIMTNESSISNGIVNKLGPTLEDRDGYCTFVSDYSFSQKFIFGLHYDWPEDSNTVSSTTSVVDGLWHHVLALYNGTTMTVYVDGSPENSESYSSGILLNDHPLKIGLDPLTVEDRHFNGNIDDIRIYNRALSRTEIQALYNE